MLYLNGNITDTALVNSLSALKLGKQYAVVTQKGCDAVRIEKELDISGFEKRFLRTIADKNRKSGVDFANRVCKDYRREKACEKTEFIFSYAFNFKIYLSSLGGYILFLK